MSLARDGLGRLKSGPISRIDPMLEKCIGAAEARINNVTEPSVSSYRVRMLPAKEFPEPGHWEFRYTFFDNGARVEADGFGSKDSAWNAAQERRKQIMDGHRRFLADMHRNMVQPIRASVAKWLEAIDAMNK
jgi:hypothetical protein